MSVKRGMRTYRCSKRFGVHMDPVKGMGAYAEADDWLLRRWRKTERSQQFGDDFRNFGKSELGSYAEPGSCAER